MGIVACWHHQDLQRLQQHLEMSRIDFHGRERTTRTGQDSLVRLWKRMRLHSGDRIRIVVKGEIVAFATIAGEPHSLPKTEACDIWRSTVYLREIVQLAPPLSTASCRRLRVQQSHRFDGPETSKLDRQDDLDTHRNLSHFGHPL